MVEDMGVFTPFGGEYCNYFYFLMIFFFIIFAGSLALVLFKLFSSKKSDTSPLIMGTVQSFVLYFQSRLLYSMCFASLGN